MAGTIVLIPVPPYPPVMPTTSAVGRLPIRSRVVRAGLALQPGDAGLGHPRLLVEGDRGQRGFLRGGQRPDVVVEARKRDPSVGVVEIGAQLGDDAGGVGNSPAEQARMQVPAGRAHGHVEAHQPPHGHTGRREVGRQHPRVGHDDQVAAEAFPLGPEERLEVRGADLLLALDEELQVDRQAAVEAEQPARPPPRRAPGPCRRSRPGRSTGRPAPPVRRGRCTTAPPGPPAGRRGARTRRRWGGRGRRGASRRRPPALPRSPGRRRFPGRRRPSARP